MCIIFAVQRVAEAQRGYCSRSAAAAAHQPAGVRLIGTGRSPLSLWLPPAHVGTCVCVCVCVCHQMIIAVFSDCEGQCVCV